MDKPLEEIEGGLRALLYSPDIIYMNDVEKRAQDVYRRLVRNNIHKVVRMSVPILRDIIGEDAVDAEIATWLERAPPTSKLLRLLPEEFAAWRIANGDFPHPAMGELLHWETLEIGILHALDDLDTHPKTPSLDRYIEASGSARLCSFAYPVHRMKTGDPWPEPMAAPAIVLGFRSAERLDWVELPTHVGQTIVLVAQGNTIGEALALLTQGGATVDEGFVRSWLVDLRARRALVGFPDYIEEEPAPSPED